MIAARFIGRRSELETLQRCLDRVARGGTSLAFVGGESGIGKTALLEQFLEGLGGKDDADGEGPLRFSTHCYTQETAPFRTLGNLVRELARYLQDQQAVRLDELELKLVFALVTLFPVLRRLDGAPQERRRDPLARLEPIEVRRHAVVALRELLTRLGQRRPVVLFVDDLQWADADSLAVLSRLCEPPDAPNLLVAATYRVDAGGAQDFKAFIAEVAARPDVARLELGPLEDGEARALAERVFRETVSVDAATWQPFLDAVVGEAAGNPLLVEELVRFLQSHHLKGDGGHPQGDAAPELVRLDNVIRRRVQSLPADAREVLELVAVAGEPLPQTLVAEAAGQRAGTEAWEQRITRLRAESLIRRHGRATDAEVNTFHDRIRTSVMGSLSEEAWLEHHRRLAEAMQRLAPERTDSLAGHWTAAGRPEEAKHFLREAAEGAFRKLAFEHAARLYREALALEEDASVRRTLFHKLGDALTNSGLLLDAAEAYLEAAAGAEQAMGQRLQLGAAEQLMRGGHIARGLEAMRGVLRGLQTDMAKSPGRALISMLFQRARLRLRGLGVRPRQGGALDEREQQLLDGLASASTYISLVNTIYGAELHSRYMLRALRSGDPHHVTIAMIEEASHWGIQGGRKVHRARRLAQEAARMAAELQDPRLQGLAFFSRGIIEYMAGSWREAISLLVQGEALLMEQCVGVHWELATVRHWTCFALLQIGELPELCERYDRHVSEAEHYGNHYDAASMKGRLPIVWLIRNDLQRAQEEASGVLRTYPEGSYQVQHFWHLLGRCDVHLYLGEGAEALTLLAAEIPKVRRAQLHRVQMVRCELASLQGRAALQAAERAAGDERKRLVKLARKSARRLRRETTAFAKAWGALMEAGARALAAPSDTTGTEGLLVQAIALLEEADCLVLAAAARWLLGRRRGGDEGRKLVRSQQQWLDERGVRNPPRFIGMIAPGLGHGDATE